jgi:hypothetical protein
MEIREVDMAPQEYNELRNPRYYKFLDYKEFFSNWDWEWFATLTFSESYNYSDSHTLSKPLKEWRIRLCKQEHIQVGYLNLIGWKYGHPHMHLLMLGYGSGGSRSLKDVDCSYWAGEWPYHAEIEIPRSKSDVEEYIASHAFWGRSHKERLDGYNQNLLNRLRRTNRAGGHFLL